MSFTPTPRQLEAQALLSGPATHALLVGGSRSGKTFWLLRGLILRALKAPGSRHAVLRFRFAHLVSSIIEDTWPAVWGACFPDVERPRVDRQHWFATLPNGSTVWFGGLDDDIRTEKVLGQEHATLLLNEASQISYPARSMVATRLAQRVMQKVDGSPDEPLPLRMWCDCNPPSATHWTYQLFVNHRDPDTRQPLAHPQDFAWLRMNPQDNAANLPERYLRELEALPPRLRVRFLLGEWGEAAPGALWTSESIEAARHMGKLPDWQRIVVAVDPSGAGDDGGGRHDAVGIVVVALGTDGVGDVLEDATTEGGPSTWARAVVAAYERHDADLVVGEVNFGGGMVGHVIQSTAPGTPYRAVTASRGKAVRAEPVAVLCDTGRLRFAGRFPELEDELCAMTTSGYTGSQSPNRADAMVWGATELFPGMTRRRREPRPPARHAHMPAAEAGWMAR